jgi:hypothetical protein
MPRPRTTRRKLVFGLGGAAATLAATAGIALAQVAIPNPPDDGPPQAPGPNTLTTTCGPNQTSIVKTDASPTTTSSVAFQQLPGAVTQINVPDGQSRCVKVLLTAETACQSELPADFCYVRALVDGIPMDPNGAGFQAMDSEDGTASAHAYEWVKRVGEGPHIVRIERRVGNAATTFWSDEVTFDTSLYL